MCHCLDCQRCTGSIFGVQARYAKGQVSVEGPVARFARKADSGNTITFNFCPSCGSTVFWELSGLPGFIAVAVGAFAAPDFPEPRISLFESRRHSWATVPANAERVD
jgi:hypothetical protein